jgi:hypothetical protein
MGVTGHARLPRAVRLLIRPAAPVPGRSRQQRATSQAHDTTWVSHSMGHAHRHRLRPGSSPNHRAVSQSFHLAPLGLSGAHWLDDPSDVSCKESTRQHGVDGWPLSCKQQVEGSSPIASSQHALLADLQAGLHLTTAEHNGQPTIGRSRDDGPALVLASDRIGRIRTRSYVAGAGHAGWPSDQQRNGLTREHG